MIVWGGGGGAFVNTGGRYDPAPDTWSPTAASPVTPRQQHSALWTGKRMLVWSG